MYERYLKRSNLNIDYYVSPSDKTYLSLELWNMRRRPTVVISSVSVIASCGTIEVVEDELLNTINNIITEGLRWNLPTISRSLVRYTLSFAVGRVELCNFVTDLNRYQTKTSHFQTFKPEKRRLDLYVLPCPSSCS